MPFEVLGDNATFESLQAASSVAASSVSGSSSGHGDSTEVSLGVFFMLTNFGSLGRRGSRARSNSDHTNQPTKTHATMRPICVISWIAKVKICDTIPGEDDPCSRSV